MARSILVLLAVIGIANAFKINDFLAVSSGKGVAEAWANDSTLNVAGEDFNMAYGGDKLYLVSHRNGTAVHGGIISSLVKGQWKNVNFGELAPGEQLKEYLFTLSGRLFMLAVDFNNGTRVDFRHLFAWDDDSSKWSEITLDLSDSRLSQNLTGGPDNFFRVNAPDQDGKIAYIVATDHEMETTGSETSFTKLEVVFDGSNKPINASLKFINRFKLGMAKAVIATALKDNRLLAFVANFRAGAMAAIRAGATSNATTVDISIDYYIDLANNNSKNTNVSIDNSTSPMPYVDYTVSKRIFQLGSNTSVLILGPSMIVGDHAIRNVWNLDLGGLKLVMIKDVSFPDLPNRIFNADQKGMRLLTAGLKKGAFAAKIDTY